MPGVNYVTVRNPITGKDVHIAVKEGTRVSNPHIVDGPDHGSFWRRTKESTISDGNTKFHVDTNNPDGVLGIFKK